MRRRRLAPPPPPPPPIFLFLHDISARVCACARQRVNGIVGGVGGGVGGSGGGGWLQIACHNHYLYETPLRLKVGDTCKGKRQPGFCFLEWLLGETGRRSDVAHFLVLEKAERLVAPRTRIKTSRSLCPPLPVSLQALDHHHQTLQTCRKLHA